MSKKQKLVDRLGSRPKDFTYEEARTLLGLYGFAEDRKGHTSGSRVAFVNKERDSAFRLHRPHPTNALKSYQIKELLDFINRLEG